MYICSPGRNFDIDAGDGDGVGAPFRTPQIAQIHPKSRKNSSYEDCSHFRDIFPKYEKYRYNMYMYTEKDKESDKHTKNNNL